jgi:hypothetical protein
MNRYEIGRRHGRNIFYTGYTFNAEDKTQALEIYREKSGDNSPAKEIVINEIETNVSSKILSTAQTGRF